MNRQVIIPPLVHILLTLNAVPSNGAERIYDSHPSSRFITSFSEDNEGYIWMSSMHGLNRYDGTSYLTFYASSEDGSLSHDYVYDVCADKRGDIWVGTRRGINCYRNGHFIIDGNENIFIDPIIRVLDLDDNHLVATGRQGIMKINKGEGSPSGKPEIVAEYRNDSNSWVDLITVSDEGDIWYAVTDGKTSSIVILDNKLALRNSIALPEIDYIHTITSGINHSVWISTFQKGIFAFNETSGQPVPVPSKVSELVGRRWVQFILPYTESTCLIGLFKKGMYLYDFRNDTLRNIYPEQLLDSPFYQCMVDSSGNIWLTDNLSDVKCYPPEALYTHYSPYEGNTGYICRMEMDSNGIFYFGTNINYFSYNPATGESRHLLNCYGRFSQELIDSHGRYWFSSGRNVLYRYAEDGDGLSLADSFKFGSDICSLGEDREGNVWILTNQSASYITPDGSMVDFGPLDDPDGTSAPITDRASKRIFTNSVSGGLYEYTTKDIREVGINVIGISCILTASDGSIWVGTHGNGLMRFSDGKTTHFKEGEELLDGSIKSILEDDEGNIWFSTSMYISKYDVLTGEISNVYDSVFETKGFYESECAFKDKDGNLYFGGNGGYTKIDRSDSKRAFKSKEARLLLQEVIVGGENLEMIPERLVVGHKQNDIAFKFAALRFGSGPKMNYSYKMERLDNDWTNTNENYVRYSNLSPGRYTFKVRIRQTAGEWDEKCITLPIVVRAAVWGSTVAIALYLLLAAALAFMIMRLLVRSRMQQERIRLIEAQEEIRKDQMEFMTNISHEFRTPLSLVYGPLKQLSSSSNLHPKDRSNVMMMEYNIKKLVDLSEKILKASAESTADKMLKVSRQQPAAFFKDLVNLFSYPASQKDIVLFTDIVDAGNDVYFDKDKVEKICYNLLSNAFKYSPEHSKVSFTLEVKGGEAVFSVEDNGPGIPEEKREKVFSRFDRLGKENTPISGHGIGLNYSKTLALVHKGDLEYRPAQEGGSVFTLRIPCLRTDYSDSELSEAGTIIKEKADMEMLQEKETDLQKANIVLVEDNDDVRIYLKSLLCDEFTVITCSDGEEGLDRIRTIVPDLVVSDVMMPRKDGFALCRDIKSDPGLCHIPIILLTAKADVPSSIKGLNDGAEAYISKPFDPSYLIATISSLLENRRLLQQQLLNQTSSSLKKGIEQGVLQLDDRDKQYMEMIHGILDKNLGDENFSIEDLAKAAGNSYSALYAKIKALTGSSPQYYLNAYRMNVAMEMLTSRKFTVSEVAYSIGASSPSNFSRSFKRQFGITPTEAATISVRKRQSGLPGRIPTGKDW